jgi:hypothetical protein
MLSVFVCKYPNNEMEHKFAKVPNSFVHRLFFLLIGETDRRDTVFGTTMHAVADILSEHLERSGQQKHRKDILDDICKALTVRKWNVYWNLFGYEKRYNSQPEKNHRLPEQTIASTASCVAIIVGYPNLPLPMPESNTNTPEDELSILGLPLHVAIQYGDLATVDSLCSRMTDEAVSKTPWFRRLLAHIANAIRAGRRDVVSLVLERFQGESDYWKSIYSEALDVAGQSGQVAILIDILNSKYGDHLADQMVAFRWVSQFGLDDWVQKFLDFGFCGFRCDFTPGGKYPLQCAAAGGHANTCRILLEHSPAHPAPQHYMNSIWRSAVRHGSMEMVELFERYDVSKTGSEHALLPIAAENGHLELAKWAVQNKFDQPPTTKGSKLAIVEKHRELRYFSSLRAAVRAHLDIVHWLVEEIGVEVDGLEGGVAAFGLSPLILAIDSGSEAMVKLLLNLGASPLGQQCSATMFGLEARTARAKTLDEMRKELSLGKDHQTSNLVSQEVIDKLVILAQGGHQEGSNEKIQVQHEFASR